MPDALTARKTSSFAPALLSASGKEPKPAPATKFIRKNRVDPRAATLTLPVTKGAP